MSFEFEPETTCTIGELQVGDFIVVVYTQERVRGVKFESGIKTLEPTIMKRGRREYAQGVIIETLAGSARYAFPVHFKVKARKQVR